MLRILVLSLFVAVGICSAQEKSPLLSLMAEKNKLKKEGRLAGIGVGNNKSLEAARLEADAYAYMDIAKMIQDRVDAITKAFQEQDDDATVPENGSIDKSASKKIVDELYYGIDISINSVENEKRIEIKEKDGAHKVYSLWSSNPEKLSPIAEVLAKTKKIGDTLSTPRASMRKKAESIRKEKGMALVVSALDTDKKNAELIAELKARNILGRDILSRMLKPFPNADFSGMIIKIDDDTVGLFSLYALAQKAAFKAKKKDSYVLEERGVYEADVWLSLSKTDLLDVVKEEVKALNFYAESSEIDNYTEEKYKKFMRRLGRALLAD